MPIKKIQIVPSWSFRDEAGNRLDSQLLKLLGAIHQHGKLTAAAKDIEISYRHAWNLLNKWSHFFGYQLVELEKGRGAKLSELGEKLLWAQQRAKARLEPQLNNLASELNLDIQRTLAGVSPTLRLHASHGYAVELLPKFCTNIQLDLQYKNAVDAMNALLRGSCDMAGFHVPTEAINDSLIETYSRLMKPRVHKVIRFITRRMGLMIKQGNPLEINSIRDLGKEDVRLINREAGSGTRALLDELIAQSALRPGSITGFEDEEFTHSAVAAYVASGMADVGFGVEAAARQFNLDFIPITSEYYLMICHHRTLQQEAMQRFLEIIRGEAYQQAVAKLPGYSPDECGQIVSVDEIFTWYQRD